MLRSLSRHQQRLDALYNKSAFFVNNPEMLSEWAKYLCVLTSGYVEQCVRIIYGDYVSKRAQPKIVRFVQQNINKFQNPNMEKICQLIGGFSVEWADSLRQQTEGELKDAIDSIVANKNNIAHGRDVCLTYTNLKKYYSSVQQVLSLLQNQTK